MKKVIVSTLAAAALAIAATSCVTTVPFGATGNEVGSKVGTAEKTFLFGFIPLGDGGLFNTDLSIKKAAESAGITKVGTVSITDKNFIIMHVITTTVTGE